MPCGSNGPWGSSGGTAPSSICCCVASTTARGRRKSATERLRGAAEGAGRHVARQIEAAANLKDDLAALIDRGERLADRMDGLVRANREPEMPLRRRYAAPEAELEAAGPRVRSQAERDLLRALRVTR